MVAAYHKIMGPVKSGASVYSYICQAKKGCSACPLDGRYYLGFLENEGYPVGREIESAYEIAQCVLSFLESGLEKNRSLDLPQNRFSRSEDETKGKGRQ